MSDGTLYWILRLDAILILFWALTSLSFGLACIFYLENKDNKKTILICVLGLFFILCITFTPTTEQGALMYKNSNINKKMLTEEEKKVEVLSEKPRQKVFGEKK